MPRVSTSYAIILLRKRKVLGTDPMSFDTTSPKKATIYKGMSDTYLVYLIDPHMSSDQIIHISGWHQALNYFFQRRRRHSLQFAYNVLITLSLEVAFIFPLMIIIIAVSSTSLHNIPWVFHAMSKHDPREPSLETRLTMPKTWARESGLAGPQSSALWRIYSLTVLQIQWLLQGCSFLRWSWWHGIGE